jgi:orotate phosphoribosyltransferase
VKANFTAIVSPAVGGIVPGYEMGRQLGIPAMYVERQDGKFSLRRNFTLKKNQPVLVVEDIISTGVSSRECIEAIKAAGGKPVAAACLIDRSGGNAKVGVKLVALTTLKVPAWEADKLPPHLKDIPAVKPGSRGLQ